MKKSIYLILILLISSFCSNSNDEEKLLQSFTQFVNELISQREEFHKKESKVQINQIYNYQDFKNLDQLKMIKVAIIQERNISEWNYETTKELLIKWNSEFSIISNKTTNDYVKDFCKKFNEYNIEKDKDISFLRELEKAYFDSFENYIDFFIVNNKSIEFINGQIKLNSQELLNEYTYIQSNYSRSEKEYKSYIYTYKLETLTKLKELNNKLQIPEVNSLIQLFE